jgi:hypothetical protein
MRQQQREFGDEAPLTVANAQPGDVDLKYFEKALPPVER